MRRLAFEIDHTADADYHLLQFSGPPALVETLGYNLKITDGVLRHRIIKVTPGTPPPPEPTLQEPVSPQPEARAGRRKRRGVTGLTRFARTAHGGLRPFRPVSGHDRSARPTAAYTRSPLSICR